MVEMGGWWQGFEECWSTGYTPGEWQESGKGIKENCLEKESGEGVIGRSEDGAREC